MEVMDAPLDKFYKKIYENKDRIPEDVLSIVAFSVSFALHCELPGQGDARLSH